MAYDDVSLLLTSGYLQPTVGGLLGGLFGGGQQQYGGLLGAAGGTDALMEQLIRRQLERSMQPDWGAMSAAFAKAAMPSPVKIPFGVALGQAAGALSAGDTDGTKALQALKMLEDLRIARRKQGWIDKLLSEEGSSSNKDLLDILNPTGIPGVKPLSSTVPLAGTPLGAGGKPIAPRVTGTDETTGDLSPTYGEPGATDDLQAGGGTPPASRKQAAYVPGTAPQERFLDLAAQFESGNRNIMQGVVPAGGGYNPSVGRITGPSTAQGFFQITNSTWRQFAPPEVQAQYPTAMSAPYEVQRAVARNILTEGGPQHWTNYNPRLASAVRQEGVLGALAGGEPLVNPDQSVRGSAPPDEVIPSGPRPSIPGLLRTQYTGQVNPDQSPSIQMGGQPMPPMPAVPQPQAPASASPYATSVPPMPSVPMPANMDPTRLQAYMLDLARKSAMAEALGLPNVYAPKLQVLMQSPQYQAMQEFAKKGVELQYAGPKAAQERAALQPYMLEQDAYKAHLDAVNKQIEQLGAAALDPTTIVVGDGQGGQTKIGATRAQAARAYAGLAVPELSIPARVSPRAGDTGPPKAGTPVGEPVYSPIETQMGQTLGKDFTDRRGKALDSQQAIEGMTQARQLIDGPGSIYSGTLGPAQLAIAKTVGTLTGNPSQTIANTEAFLAQRARDVAGEIKNFGAGTGLSDADRQYAAKIVGGDISLNQDSIRKIFDIGEKHHRRLIENFNKDASKVNPKVSPYPLTVDMPAYAGAPPVGTIEGGHKFLGGNPADPKSWEAQ